jgi:chromosome segregation ATPase
MSEVVSPFPTWLTYQQIAERLGLRSASAAASRARRGKWPRRIRNDTLEAEVCVPKEVLAAGPRKPREPRKGHGSGGPGDQAAAEAVAAAVAPLQVIIETLAGEVRAARESNDALREQLASAQSEAAELRGKTEALEAALDREVVDRRTLQQQVEHARRERQAAQERVSQVQAEILDERRRLHATEDLVTRLKFELRGVEQANKRRRWWHWR